MDEISGMAGPRCGGKQADTGRISFDNGAMDTRRLHDIRSEYFTTKATRTKDKKEFSRVIFVEKPARGGRVEALQALAAYEVEPETHVAVAQPRILTQEEDGVAQGESVGKVPEIRRDRGVDSFVVTNIRSLSTRHLAASPSPSTLETFSSSDTRLSKLSSDNLPTSNIVTAWFFRPCDIK